jgi:ABC-type Fe3+/spermidine/putrescine transport system ATPase subunit
MIQVENLFKQFDQRGIAGIHKLSFALDKGEILGVMGPNGSGKSTLLKILSDQMKADGGTFTAKGKVTFFSTEKIHPASNVLNFLVNAVKLEIDHEKKIQLARDLADTFEFTFQLRQTLDELSTGQLQKILLSKKLINQPALLLMDEPFTHLDPFTRINILNGLFKYIKNQNLTLIWVTHDLDEALKFSDKIALMNFGKFEQFSTPEELIKSPKNLFVAKFVGYKNFFSTQKSENGWSTPWGNMNLVDPGKKDGILIVPDTAWKIGIDGLAFVVRSMTPSKQGFEALLEYENRTIHWYRGPNAEMLKINSRVSLFPLIEECLHIAL